VLASGKKRENRLHRETCLGKGDPGSAADSGLDCRRRAKGRRARNFQDVHKKEKKRKNLDVVREKETGAMPSHLREIVVIFPGAESVPPKNDRLTERGGRTQVVTVPARKANLLHVVFAEKSSRRPA